MTVLGNNVMRSILNGRPICQPGGRENSVLCSNAQTQMCVMDAGFEMLLSGTPLMVWPNLCYQDLNSNHVFKLMIKCFNS